MVRRSRRLRGFEVCETKIGGAIEKKNAESRQKIRIFAKKADSCQVFLTGFGKNTRILSEF
jgi:hypothetical protein